HALLMSTALATLLSFTAPSAYAAAAKPADIEKAIKSPARPQTDMWRDAARHPAEVITFAGIKPGDVVVDFGPGNGYYTRIFSKLVGPKGHVYPVVNLSGYRDARLIREAEEKAGKKDPIDDVLPIQFVGGFENVQAIWENIARDKG